MLQIILFTTLSAYRKNISNLYPSTEVGTYPNVPFTVHSGIPFASAVFWNTMLPHHLSTLFSPIDPLSGYCRQKNTRTMEHATPESSAAERTSKWGLSIKCAISKIGGYSQLYFDHHEKCLLRMTHWKMNPTTPHVT